VGGDKRNVGLSIREIDVCSRDVSGWIYFFIST
jgi:hypothetical protein